MAKSSSIALQVNAFKCHLLAVYACARLTFNHLQQPLLTGTSSTMTANSPVTCTTKSAPVAVGGNRLAPSRATIEKLQTSRRATSAIRRKSKASPSNHPTALAPSAPCCHCSPGPKVPQPRTSLPFSSQITMTSTGVNVRASSESQLNLFAFATRRDQ